MPAAEWQIRVFLVVSTLWYRQARAIFFPGVCALRCPIWALIIGSRDVDIHVLSLTRAVNEIGHSEPLVREGALKGALESQYDPGLKGVLFFGTELHHPWISRGSKL